MRSDADILQIAAATPPWKLRICPSYGQSCGCLGCVNLTREEWQRYIELEGAPNESALRAAESRIKRFA